MTTKSVRAVRFEAGTPTRADDAVTVEAPLQIRVNGVAFTTTMRTPGDDCPLARGLLFTEGVVTDRAVQPEYREIRDQETTFASCLDVTVPEGLGEKEVEGRRTTLSASSCGMCGTRDPADIEIYGPPLTLATDRTFDVGLVPRMLDTLRAGQATFEQSGGSHAAGLFTIEGELLALYEDIGRHNAVDKTIGHLLDAKRLDDGQCLMVSGRVSYEIVYKAYRAEIPILLAVSAPSSMAVETAQRLGMTVIGFCWDRRATVYSTEHDIVGEQAEQDGNKILDWLDSRP